MWIKFNVHVARVNWCLCLSIGQHRLPWIWLEGWIRGGWQITQAPHHRLRWVRFRDARPLTTHNIGGKLCGRYSSVVEHATLDREFPSSIPGAWKTPLKELFPLYPKCLHYYCEVWNHFCNVSIVVSCSQCLLLIHTHVPFQTLFSPQIHFHHSHVDSLLIQLIPNSPHSLTKLPFF